jgi:hypothetical protein
MMDSDEELCVVQVMLMEIYFTRGIDSEEYRLVERRETELIRRIVDGD